ncbi:2Fe-2S iron-sulfur cluster-binding protein [Pseudomaricurvus sp. HS19]|uniref:2Fe-2S iron-sulfur cluster-binding protein n=1 Tax=Pseudomaricurvus sp. HS19 TaxID=2692626 RepID=UPI00136C32E2|nr:2Fe-2S iron-sulfur cluster-binding protein [Pseudomaricurvus sp. HS19]MYM64875.1 2Fe-2S iron-sulfur cluster binding domain-containing protein [Pseudomaricurvus sp. HS19]
MTIVNYIDHDGTAHEVDVPNGDSVMQGAVDNGLEGILGECGGGLACATCLCFVDPDWRDRTGEASEMEKEMLEFSAHGTEPGSRLSCQITVSDELEGLVVRLPESQY